MTTETTTAVAVPNGHGLTTPGQPAGFAIEGFENLSQRDVILPRWTIVQPISKMEGGLQHIGQFHRNIDGEFRPTLTVVLLRVEPTRILWSGVLTDKHPECASRDGVTGNPYGECGQCTYNVFVNPALREQLATAPQGAKPKVCQSGYTAMMVDDLEAGTMALLGALGTSVKPFKILITQFVQKRRSPFSAVVELATEQVNDAKGNYFVLRPRIMRVCTDAEIAEYRGLYLALKGSVVKDIDEEDPAAAPDEPPSF